MSCYKLLRILRCIHRGSNIQANSFGSILSSHSRLQALKLKQVGFKSVWQLLQGLVNLNLAKLMVCLLFFVLTSGITVSAPFIINYILQTLLDTEDRTSTVPVIALLIVTYKLGASLVSIVCDFLYVSIGYQYFAYLYWFILDHYPELGGNLGKIVNMLEYDCNLMTNIVYSSLTTIFYCMEIIVLFGLLIKYLAGTCPFPMFISLICAYVGCQVVTSLATFYFNRTYIYQKDRRLGVNISDFDGERMLEERAKELKANKRYLLMRMVSKSISLLFPILINVYVFLVADRNSIRENEYTILILINLIRNPISELMTAMSLNAEILNSCRRMVELVNRAPEATPSLLSEELIAEESRVVAGRMVSQQRGCVNLNHIWKSVTETIKVPYLLGLTFLFLMLVLSRYYGNFVTKHMVAQNFGLENYLGLCSQLLFPILFYFLLIVSIQKIAVSLFSKLKQEIDCQTLNRISGDIAAVDRSVTINLFQIGFALAIILSSYLYSILSLGVGWLEVTLIMFLGLCIWVAFALNRFIMHSRREVARRELEMKSGVLRGLIEGTTISSNAEMKDYWFRIFECKQMGLLIENYYMLAVSLLMLVLSLSFVLLSAWLVTEPLTKSILIMACLSIDRDMLLLFYALVRLQLSLVSFERVLNVLVL